MEKDPYDVEAGNDNTQASLVVRAASVAGLITAGMGFPNIWRSLEKNYPSGLTTSVLSMNMKKQMNTAELSMVLGKAALDLHKDPSILGSIAYDAARRSSARTKTILEQAEENERLRQFIEIEKQERSSFSSYHDTLAKKSLFDKVRYVEREIENRTAYGRKDFKKNINGVPLHAKGRFTSPAEIKREIILDTFKTLRPEEISAIFPGLSHFTEEELREKNLIVFDYIFKGIMEKGGSLGTSFAREFLDRASDKNPHLTMFVTPKGKRVTLSGIRTILFSDPLPAIRYNMMDETFMKERRKNLFKRTPPVFFEQENVIADLMDNIDNQFSHIADKEMFGLARNNLRNLFTSMKHEYDKLTPGARKGKKFGVRIDPNTQSIVMFAQHESKFTDTPIEHSVRIPIPNRQNNLNFTTTNRVLLTMGVAQHGEAIRPVSSFEMTTYELSKFAKALLHGTYTEPRDGENRSLQSSVNRLYSFDRPTGNGLTDFSKGRVIRSQDPWLRENSRMRMNRVSGLTQHNVLSAAQRSGRDILMYDQEFIAGREGPQVVAKNPHLASPYQVSYRKISASGKIISGGSIYIKTDENMKAIRAWKEHRFGDLDYIRFKESLEAIGKGDSTSIANIINEIEHGVSADEAYKHVFSTVGKGCLFADYGGQGGPDRELIKFQTGIDYIGQAQSIDLYKMLKAGSSTKRGWSLLEQFTQFVESSTDTDFVKIEKTMLGHAGTMSHRLLLDDYKQKAKADPHNRRKALINAAIANAHDASVDTAMQCVILDKLMAYKPLLGALGSRADRLSRLANNPSLTFREKVQTMNNSVISAHFYGDKSSAFGNINPTTRSDRQILKGITPGVSANNIDLWAIGNSGMKQEHQKLYGIRMFIRDKKGKFRDPFSIAFREQLDQYGKHGVSSNIAANAEPVMANVLLTSRGTGDFFDNTILAERQTLNDVLTERELNLQTINLGKVGELQDSRVTEFLHKIAKAHKKPLLFQDGRYLGTKGVNEVIANYIENERVGIVHDMEAGLIDANTDNRYLIKQNDVIAHTFMSPHKMTHGVGRFSYLSFIENNKGELEMTYRIAQSVGLEKTWIGDNKANVEAIKSVDNLRHRDWEVAGEVTKNSLRPTIIAPFTMLKRGEIGTARKVQFMRIYTQFLAQGREQHAKNFLHTTTGLAVHNSKYGPLVKLSMGSVEEQLNLFNNISSDKLYQGLIDSGLVWNRHDLKMSAKYYDINHASDIGTANDYDRIVTQMWEKNNSEISRRPTENYTKLLDSVMDNTALKELRAIYNPFFHKLQNRIVDPLKIHTARHFDPTEYTDAKGHSQVDMSIRTAQTLETIATHHIQVPGVRVSMLRMGSYLDKSIQKMNAAWEGSFTQHLLNGTIGSFRKKARDGAVRYLSTMWGTESLSGHKIVKIHDFDIALKRTLANRAIMKDLAKDGKIDMSKITKDVYNKYMKKGWDDETTVKYTQEAEALEKKAAMKYMTGTTEKDKLLADARVLRQRALEIQSKPMHDYGIMPTEEEIRGQSGTLLEKINTSPYMREFSDSKNTMHVGNTKIAPHDLLLFQAKGVSNVANRKFFKTIVDNVVEVRKLMGDVSPQTAKQRNMLDNLIEMMNKNLAAPESDKVILPTAQAVAELEGLSTGMLGKAGLGWDGLSHAYTGVLTALSELENATGGHDVFAKRTEQAIFHFTSHFTNIIMGKKRGKNVNLLYGEEQYQVLGLRGLVKSPYAARVSIEEALKELKPGEIAGKHEMPIEQQKRLAELLKGGQHGFIDKESFSKMKVGDVSVRDFLIKKVGKANYQKIMEGRQAIPLVSLRNPVETGTQMMGLNEYFVYDNNSRLFKNMPKGIIPSLQFLLKAKADTDGDEMGVAMLNFMNAKQFNQALIDTRLFRARENAMVTKYHENVFKTGNYKDAMDVTKKYFLGRNLHGVKVHEGELQEALRMGKEYLEDQGKYMKYDNAIGAPGTSKKSYTLETLSRKEQIKLGKLSIIDATAGALERYGSNIRLEGHIAEMINKVHVQNIGKLGIGVVASYATRTTIQLNSVRDYMLNLKKIDKITPALSEDLKLMGLFPQLDFKRPATAMKHLHGVIDKYTDHMQDAFSKIERILRDPEQHLISTKKQIDPNASEMMFQLIENIENVHENRFKHVRDFFGLEFSDTQLAALREGKALHKTLSKHDPFYKMNTDKAIAYTSGKGIGSAMLEQVLAGQFINRNIGKLSSTQIEHIASLESDRLTSGFSEKMASAWRDSAKQLLYQNHGKSMMFMGVGLALMTAGNSNSMTGGVLDFGMDLGHRPGFSSSSNAGMESLAPEDGQDVFSKKWTYLLKHDPVLKDNMSELSDKRYKDLNMNNKLYQAPDLKKKYKRNYIDMRKTYNSRYETNDMRRAKIASF